MLLKVWGGATGGVQGHDRWGTQTRRHFQGRSDDVTSALLFNLFDFMLFYVVDFASL